MQISVKSNRAIRERRTGRGSQTQYLLHKISFVATMGRSARPGMQISHICDNRRCFNPDHLVEESPEDNNGRKGCPGNIYCPDHNWMIAALCRHQPECIRPPPTLSPAA